jgi:hypothetical protein
MEKATQALNAILDLFENGNVPEALAFCALLPHDVPAQQWSLGNRMLMFMAGTSDARGFKQWQQVGRKVNKGAKAFYIVAPFYKKEKEEEEKKLIGFRAVPVFRIEDTDGEVLPEYQPQQAPPLIDVANAWHIPVRYLPFQGRAYGYYKFGEVGGEIVLASHDEQVFFHEIAHAAHHRVCGSEILKHQWKHEVVAELVAAVLMRLYGRRDNEGAAYRYIKMYAEKGGKSVHQACLSVLQDTGKVLDEILLAHQDEQAVAGQGSPAAA